MPDWIHISQIKTHQWMNTSLVRSDGKIEYRQRPAFGNNHAVFEPNSEWGLIHNDKFNALDFPNGTVDHLSKYTEEKTGIPHDLAKAGIILGSILIGVKLLQKLEDS